MKNTVSSLIVLSAGMVAVLCCIFMNYTLEATLIVLVTVLFLFFIIGYIAQRVITSMTKEAEERFQREEALRREAEAAAEAAALEAEAAALAESEAALLQNENENVVAFEDVENEMYYSETDNSVQE